MRKPRGVVMSEPGAARACITNNRLIQIVLLLAFVLSGLHPISAPAAEVSKSMAGPEFSNPDKRASMPKSWRDQAIQYEPADRGSDLVVSLGQQTYPALHKVVRKFASEKGLRITIKKGTCGISAGKLVRKTVDIGGYCCPPGDTDRLPGLRFQTVAIAPIALIVHPDNPVSNITTDEARRIYQGKLRKWGHFKQLSDKGALASLTKPAARLHCKVRPGHWRGLLGREDMFTSRVYEVGVIPDMISYVAKTKGAIGYETQLMIKEHKSQGKVKILSIDGRGPDDLKYILSGKYPIYRVYNFATWENNDPIKKKLSQELITYIKVFIKKHDREYGLICTSKLKKAGWRFKNGELIGKPGS